MLEVEGVLSIDKVNPSLIKSLAHTTPKSETAQEYRSRSFYIFSLCVFSLCDNKGRRTSRHLDGIDHNRSGYRGKGSHEDITI